MMLFMKLTPQTKTELSTYDIDSSFEGGETEFV